MHSQRYWFLKMILPGYWIFRLTEQVKGTIKTPEKI
jgi:hypothetical protein